MNRLWMAAAVVLAGCADTGWKPDPAPTDGPYVVVLGIAQDGGVPQAGDLRRERWTDTGSRRLVASLGLVADASVYVFDATPDFPEQLWRLADAAGPLPLGGVFLTHAHIGHYTGLVFLGHEAIGARGIPVYTTGRMQQYLSANGPWSQLVSYGNIAIRVHEDGDPVVLPGGVRVTPFTVPHRQEFADVVGYRIEGPSRSIGYIPDIDSWHAWDEAGVDLAAFVRSVDVALVDGTFFADGEIPGRDMSGFPHPFITTTMDRLADLPERNRVAFIHLNHTNPALDPDSKAARLVRSRGFRIAREGEIVPLGRSGGPAQRDTR